MPIFRREDLPSAKWGGNDPLLLADAVMWNPSIADSLAEAYAVLELSDDWDGEGSPAYRDSTVRRAIDLFRAMAHSAFTAGADQIAAPEFGPAEAGSIDIYWNTPRGQLLVNVPAVDRPPTYAWLSPTADRARGSVRTDADISALAAWMQSLS